jgi:hypothetical protein
MSNHDRKGPDTPERDAMLEQAWHQASNEQPPSRLDAAILAAAHEAVENRVAPASIARGRSRSWLTRWQPVAAAAAVTGLAFILVQMLPRERSVAPTLQVEEPAIEAEQKVLARPAVRSEMERPATAVERPSASSVANEAVADRAAAGAAAEAEQREVTVPDVSSGAAPARMAVPGNVAEQGAAPAVSAAAWAARVAALYDSGELARATDALREFRAAYPDADRYLSESLREWARTVD